VVGLPKIGHDFCRHLVPTTRMRDMDLLGSPSTEAPVDRIAVDIIEMANSELLRL